MKKIISMIAIFSILFMSICVVNIYADSLDTINITTDKQTVHPNETVKVNVEFGKDLGSYTVDIAYDNNLLEYVSTEGGTANDNGTRIRAYFYDQTGGSTPRNNMSVTFKAKDGIITSNPTDFSITAEGLASPDASILYDDITTPIVKNIVVEPVYIDYAIALNYAGDIMQNEEKNMKIVISSAMGKNYEHTRIIAEATTPTGETVKLLATDNQGLEHDIIQSGWGDASGNPIGGKDVMKELDVKGVFSAAGNYSITMKLIDRDNSDAEIASKTFQIVVTSQSTITPPNNEEQVPPTTGTNNNENNTSNVEQPQTLPKTGNMIYFTVMPIILILIVAYLGLRKKK